MVAGRPRLSHAIGRGRSLQLECRMKSTTVLLSSAFLAFTIASSFSSSAYAARRGSMSGYDSTYGTTGKCSGGPCNVEKPKTEKPR
jgi:hypothetical protein